MACVLTFTVGVLLWKVKLPGEFQRIVERFHLPELFIAAAFISLVALIFLISRFAHPGERVDRIGPSAIKGPMSFGPSTEDGELFQQLGRTSELSQLLGWVLDDRIPLVAVMGTSGAGKTSLLHSGLEYLLRSRNPPIDCAYWEALPSDPVTGLLHALREGLPEKPFTNLSEFALSPGPHRVVILDQIEQLDPSDPLHIPIFDLLRGEAARPIPHRTTWVVVFRRRFSATWREFELTVPLNRLRQGR